MSARLSAKHAVDPDRLLAALRGQERFAVAAVEVFPELESTNRHLLADLPAVPSAMRVCIAEFQTHGRGRRGRTWRSPPAAGLCLSAGWLFIEAPRDLATITLAAGVVAHRAIESSCGVAIGLKWPNDLVWNDRKLGGILVELATSARDRCHVVVGVGINVAVPVETLASLSDWPCGAVDLQTAAAGEAPDRTELAALLCRGLGDLFVDYTCGGFDVYRDAWRRADCLVGAPVVVRHGAGELRGTAGGIDDDGALLLRDAHRRLHRVTSGDVSVRVA